MDEVNGEELKIVYDMKDNLDSTVTRSNVRWQDAEGNDIEPVDDSLANAILAFQAFHSMHPSVKKSSEEKEA